MTCRDNRMNLDGLGANLAVPLEASCTVFGDIARF
jgi:hypothetical protein